MGSERNVMDVPAGDDLEVGDDSNRTKATTNANTANTILSDTDGDGNADGGRNEHSEKTALQKKQRASQRLSHRQRRHLTPPPPPPTTTTTPSVSTSMATTAGKRGKRTGGRGSRFVGAVSVGPTSARSVHAASQSVNRQIGDLVADDDDDAPIEINRSALQGGKCRQSQVDADDDDDDDMLINMNRLDESIHIQGNNSADSLLPSNTNSSLQPSNKAPPRLQLAPPVEMLIEADVARCTDDQLDMTSTRQSQNECSADEAAAVLDNPHMGGEANSLQTTKAAENGSKKCCGWTALVLLAVIALIVGLIFGLSNDKTTVSSEILLATPTPSSAGVSASIAPTSSPINSLSTNTQSPTLSPTALPTEAPTIHHTQELLDLVNILEPFLASSPTFTNRRMLLNPSTLQYQTLDWMAHFDVTAADLVNHIVRNKEGQASAVTSVRSNDTIANSTVQEYEKTLLERYVASFLHFAWNGEIWSSNFNFLSNQTICDWNRGSDGILCTPLGTVESISIGASSYDDVVGIMPNELYHLTDMKSFTLIDTSLEGTISSHIANLKSLTTLEIQAQLMKGTIPTEIGHLEELQMFGLFGLFEGNLPSQVGNLVKLQDVYIVGTNMDGGIPSEIGMLSDLVSFQIYDNQFSGTLPMELNQIESLSSAIFHDNDITGTVDSIFCTSLNPSIYLVADCLPIQSGQAAVPEVICSCCAECCDRDGANCEPNYW